MTVRELIVCLLNEPMDAEIGLQDRTEHIDSEGEKCSGYVFDIDDIEHWSKHRIFINFTDWRADRKTEPQVDDLIRQADEMIKFDEELLQMDESQSHSGEVTEMVEPKQGEWIRTFDGNEWFWYCSNCKQQWYEDDLWMGGNEFPHFCPDCGARMKGADE